MHQRIYDIYRQRIHRMLGNENRNIYPQSIPLKAVFAKTKDPVPFAERLKLKYSEATVGMLWGHEWESAWFHVGAVVPKEFAGKTLCLRIHTGGECCVFDKNGCPIYGLTGHSHFDNAFYKDRFVLGKLKPGTKIDYWVEAAANGLFGINQPAPTDINPPKPMGSFEAYIREMSLCVFDEDVYHMLVDFRCLNELLDAYGLNDYRGKQLLDLLNKAIDLYNYDPANAKAVRKLFAEKMFSRPAVASALTACCVGHAHIDVGWLWPVRESIRKCARTFSSQIALMEKYPDYIFGESQAQLYQMTKDHYPELFAKIQKRVKEGRWELQGGWWVEADCNLISGESMVRQFLHGKNFFMDNFGVNVRNLWIPDVFGYSASLPQIIRKADCDYFLTQKISWSQVNSFPHNTFRWIGVDGSEVLTHFPPEDTYNAECRPRQRIDAQNRFREAGYLDQFMSLMGIGDGGGGPSEDFVERNIRIKNLEGVPKAVYKKACDFFEELAPRKDELPVWNGELYLELHRGTLTTQAHTKRNNRKCEQALTALEFIASCLPKAKYPAAKLDKAWKTVLLNQFHDIIPGSSIGLVYQTTEKEHAAVLAMASEEMDKAAKALFKKKEASAVIVNTLPVAWHGTVELPESWKNAAICSDDGQLLPTQLEDGRVVAFVVVQPSSFLTIRQTEGKAAAVKKSRNSVLENDIVKYTFDKDGQLVSAVDKRDGREILSAPGNVLSLYYDRPNNWEAWDVDMFYPRDFKEHPKCVKIEQPVCGPARSFMKFTFKTDCSTIEQTVVLRPNSTRLDFVTHVDWHEQRIMMRTAFPVNVQSDFATFDIQYAFVKRPTHDNTSWEEAKFETCGQRYADLSQDDYGVALLNDCKYGYRVKGNVLDLNLLRSPKNPDYNADQGEHTFIYSFFPHAGNHLEGCIPDEAAVLNRDPYLAEGYANDKAEPPCTVESDSVNLEVVKKAEKDDSTILRLVETAGRHATAVLKLANPKAKVSVTNLIEWEKGKSLPVENGCVNLSLKPFEIMTLRLA